MVKIENESEFGCDVIIGDTEFHVHAEPSRAQKDHHIKVYGDDNVPPPYPWWAASDWFAGGPYETKGQAISACEGWLKSDQPVEDK